MDTETLPTEEAETAVDAIEEEAEATRTARSLFEYSRYVHAGLGAEECEHREDGKCQETGHFHAWVCLPNSLQHRDIMEKARAAKARRRRAMKDAGDQNRPASDGYVSLEADLDELLEPDNRAALVTEVAERAVRRSMGERMDNVREGDERFEHYWQDREEWLRQTAMPEEERPTEEYEALSALMEGYEEAVEKRIADDTAREEDALRTMETDALREVVRGVRIDGEGSEAHLTAYWTWMGFIGCRNPAHKDRRMWASLEAFRNAAPEAVQVVDDALRDLEARTRRGDAAGN